MNAKAYALLSGNHARAWCCALALGWLPLAADAAKKADFGQQPITQSGRATTFSPMGTPLNGGGSTIPVSPTVGGWTAAGNYGFPSSATGPTAGVNYKGQFADGGSPVGQAMKYPYTASSTVPWSDVAKAIPTMGCSLISGGALALACMVAVPLVVDWMAKGGARLNPATGELERKDPLKCTVAPCYLWSGNAGGVSDTQVASPQLACENFITRSKQLNAGYYYGAPTASLRTDGWVGYYKCDFKFNPNNNSALAYDSSANLYRGSTRPLDPETWLPASMNDIAPYMGTPASGNVIGQMIEQGATIPLGNPTITGPASITGPVTTTINNDGSRTTNSTVHNYTTAGNTVTNTSNVTTTTTYNTDNSVRNTSTSTTVPTEEQDPGNPCEKNPDTVGCAKMDIPEGKIPKETKTITYSEESVFGSGSCPSDKTYASVTLGRSVKVVDWTKTCQYASPLSILIVALATFAAFLIVLPGSKVET